MQEKKTVIRTEREKRSDAFSENCSGLVLQQSCAWRKAGQSWLCAHSFWPRQVGLAHRGPPDWPLGSSKLCSQLSLAPSRIDAAAKDPQSAVIHSFADMKEPLDHRARCAGGGHSLSLLPCACFGQSLKSLMNCREYERGCENWVPWTAFWQQSGMA